LEVKNALNVLWGQPHADIGDGHYNFLVFHSLRLDGEFPRPIWSFIASMPFIMIVSTCCNCTRSRVMEDLPPVPSELIWNVLWPPDARKQSFLE
jgi:hypothetical protein